MKKNKIAAVFMSLTMMLSVVAGTTTAGFAVTYPSDVMGTDVQVPVTNLIDRGILTGSDDGKFYPNSNLTRAEVAVIMAKAGNKTGELSKIAQQNIFTDLKDYDWAKGYINSCANAGIVSGYGDGTYGPGKNVSYAEFITFLIRTKNPSADTAFAGQWPDNFITYATMYNMMRDVSVSDWNAPIKRGEVAKLVYYNMPKANSGSATVSLSPSSATAASGAVVTFSANAVGSGQISYAWAVDGITDYSATGSTYSYKMPDGGAHTITLTVTNQQLGKNPVTTSVSAKIN